MHLHFSRHKSKESKPLYLIKEGEDFSLLLPDFAMRWAKLHNFTGKEGQIFQIPSPEGELYGVVCGLGAGRDAFVVGDIGKHLMPGFWHFVYADPAAETILHYLALALGTYHFSAYPESEAQEGGEDKKTTVALSSAIDQDELLRLWHSTVWMRDLINMPANLMTPEALEREAQNLAERYNASCVCYQGKKLLEHNFPLIYAVGQAGAVAPRLMDLRWGNPRHPKVTLVGKGVCFDTGGLDIKPSSSMLLMKKDMGGAASVLGLAKLIMDARLPVALRVLIPAVENAIAGNAFRPGDVLRSRKGLSVEIGNTDAEGRLILADALSYADEEAPELLIDMATLTGAARVALGPDLAAFFSSCDRLSSELERLGTRLGDPLWRLPLWEPYCKKLHSRCADLNNVSKDGFAGSITAALFLKSFVEHAKHWLHFDIYGWTPVARPGFPEGGEGQAVRSLYALLKERYGVNTL